MDTAEGDLFNPPLLSSGKVGDSWRRTVGAVFWLLCACAQGWGWGVCARTSHMQCFVISHLGD